MSETATIAVAKIRDGEGQPTCRWWEQQCPFLMYSRFGAQEHCYWLDDCGKQGLQLDRREHGKGTTIPHASCPVWHGQEVKP